MVCKTRKKRKGSESLTHQRVSIKTSRGPFSILQTKQGSSRKAGDNRALCGRQLFRQPAPRRVSLPGSPASRTPCAVHVAEPFPFRCLPYFPWLYGRMAQATYDSYMVASPRSGLEGTSPFPDAEPHSAWESIAGGRNGVGVYETNLGRVTCLPRGRTAELLRKKHILLGAALAE